jgi:hypothetical protein
MNGCGGLRSWSLFYVATPSPKRLGHCTMQGFSDLKPFFWITLDIWVNRDLVYNLIGQRTLDMPGYLIKIVDRDSGMTEVHRPASIV